MRLWRVVELLFIGLAVCSSKPIPIVEFADAASEDFPTLTNWDVLAPFPAAPRELGADPLQAWGGIFGIPRADNSTYPSDIYNGGFVGWTSISTTANGAVNIQYNETTQVNWPLIEEWAGEAGSMWQGWAISDFTLSQDAGVLVTCIGVGTIYVDSRLTNGDKYYAGYAMTPLYLSAGTHSIYVLVLGYETAEFQCSIAPINASNPISALNDILAPSIMEGYLAAPYVSVTLLNNLDVPITKLQVEFVNSSSGQQFSITQQWGPNILPSQTLPVGFALAVENKEIIQCNSANQLQITVNFYTISDPVFSYTYTFTLSCALFNESFVFTFLDFDNSIQYSAARAPAKTCPPTGCPIILTLHGAGVEAKSGAWTYAYYHQNNTWMLFPTNRRNYGWDWQGPGLLNALQALSVFASTLPGVPPNLVSSYRADETLVIYAGHSMGGHGCWTISTHYPDKAIAVLPAAGWISMGLYTPSFLRLGNSLSDPWVQFLMNAAVADYNDDFYTPHLVGIPLMIRMGSDDDNVPPYHLRRMARLVDELSKNPHTVQVSEVPGVGHWFNGVVDDPTLQKFFNSHYSTTLPPLPENFTVVTLNPATSGGRGGIRILQMTTPYRSAKINVENSNTETWTLTTENVRRFSFYPLNQSTPEGIILDGSSLPYVSLPDSHYCLISSQWEVCTDGGKWQLIERGPLSYGPLEQVLKGPLTIVYGTQDSLGSYREDLAIYIANSLYYQARYSIQIVPDYAASFSDISNVILLGGPYTNSFTLKINATFPVFFTQDGFQVGPRTFSSPATGIAFLAAYSYETSPAISANLCAVLEGTDQAGLLKAVSLLPMLSTVTTPDYAVAGPKWGYEGGAGLLALGFWNNFWQFDPTTGYVTSL